VLRHVHAPELDGANAEEGADRRTDGLKRAGEEGREGKVDPAEFPQGSGGDGAGKAPVRPVNLFEGRGLGHGLIQGAALLKRQEQEIGGSPPHISTTHEIIL